MKIFKSKSFLMWIFIVALYCLLAVRDMMSINIPQYLILAVGVAYIPFANYKNLVSYCAFLIPLIIGINALIMFFILVALYLKAKKINRYQYQFLFYFIPAEVILYLLLPSDHRINDIFIYSSLLALFFYLMFDENKNVDYDTAIKLFCYSGVFALFLVAYKFYEKFGLTGIFLQRMDDIYKYDENFDTTLQVFSLNANNTGYYSAVIYACMLLGRKRLKIPTIIYWPLFGLNILIAGLTVSRTWLIVVCFITLLYCFFQMSKIKLAIAVALIFILGGSLGIYFQQYTETFNTRLHNKSMEGGNGRIELFEEYNQFMIDNPGYDFMGTGTVSYKEIIPIHNSMHNGIQQIFVCTGIIGLLIFVYSGVSFYKQFIKHRKIKFIYFLPFIAAFIFLQTIQFLNPHFLMLPVCICLMSIKMGATKQYLLQ